MTNPTSAPSPQQAVANELRRAAGNLLSVLPNPTSRSWLSYHAKAEVEALHAALAPQAMSEPPAGVAADLRERLVQRIKLYGYDAERFGLFELPLELLALIDETTPTHQAAEPAASEAPFKNFHRSLCARFGYVHDEKDWRRDLVSLEEHIARAVQPQSAASDMVLVPRESTREMLQAMRSKNLKTAMWSAALAAAPSAAHEVKPDESASDKKEDQ